MILYCFFFICFISTENNIGMNTYVQKGTQVQSLKKSVALCVSLMTALALAAGVSQSTYADEPVRSEAACNANGTIKVNVPGGDTQTHLFAAYKIAGITTPDQVHIVQDGGKKYVENNDLRYSVPAQIRSAVAEALKAAGKTSATADSVDDVLVELQDSEADTPWGFTSGTATAESAKRKFVEHLAGNLGSLTPTTLVKNNAVTLERGLYLITDNMTATNDDYTASLKMMTSTTLCGVNGLRKADGTNVDVTGEINVKNTHTDATKAVGGETPALSYNIGDEVPFVLTGVIPDYTGFAAGRVYTIKDTYQKVGNNSPFDTPTDIVVSLMHDGAKSPLTANVDYVAEATADGLTVDFAKLVNGEAGANTSWKTGDQLIVEFKAVLNNNATVTNAASEAPVTGCDAVGNCNKVSVEFSSVPDTPTTTDTYDGNSVNVYSYKLDVKKVYKSDQSQTLNNAQFAIKNADGKYLAKDAQGKYSELGTTRPTASPLAQSAQFDAAVQNAKGVFATSGAGELNLGGLKAGTYTVEEIAAPEGYYQSALPSYTVEIGEKKDDSSPVLTSVSYAYSGSDVDSGMVSANAESKNLATVMNVKSIVELPLTGAAGIALFVVLGILLCSGAALLALRAYKVSKNTLTV